MPGVRPKEFTPTVTSFSPAAVLRAGGETESHVAFAGVDVWNGKSVALVLVTTSFCEAEPLTAVLKFNATGFATSMEPLLTYMLTGMVSGLFGNAAPVVGLMPLIVTAPVHVVPETMLPGVTVIGKVASFVTTAVVTPDESQAVPQAAFGVIDTVALKLAWAPVLLVTRMFCVVGLFCPI